MRKPACGRMKSLRLAFMVSLMMAGTGGRFRRVEAQAPFDIPKFQAAIAECKLQAPTSSTAATQEELVAGYSSSWFYVADTDKMAFNQSGASQRTELRYLTNWDASTADRTAHANLKFITQTCDQVTVMQIHDDANAGPGPNKPLLRIYRHQNKTPVNHLWAAIKTDSSGSNTEHVDLGLAPTGYFDCDITLSGGIMSIAIDGTILANRDISFWNFPSYWKAGVYLQDDGDATVYFNELTWSAAASNGAPSWNSDPVVKVGATEDDAYSSTLADDAFDPEGDPMTFLKVSGPAWLSVAADGVLSGTPGAGDVGVNIFTIQVDATGGSDTAELQITVNAAGSPIVDYAVSELTVSGTISGSIADTFSSDDIYETLTEVESGGKPSKRHSLLEHKWTFDVTGGEMVTFHVEAHHTANAEGDDFLFAYSTDDVSYNDMVTVTKTADDNTAQFYSLPGGTSGTVYIRVVDTDRAQGNKVLDSLNIDAMFIVSEQAGSTPPTEATNPNPIDGATGVALSPVLTWTAGTLAASHDVYFGTDSTLDVGEFQGSQTGTSFAPATLTAATTYYWKIDEINSAGTTVGPVWSFTTTSESVSDMYVFNIAMSSASYGGNRYSGIATITITNEFGGNVSGATVSIDWTDATSSSDSAATDGSGVVVFESSKKKNGGTFTVTVTGVSASGSSYSYNSALNVESTDSITVP